MIVRIASTRQPKINGVHRALEKLSVQFTLSPSSWRIESTEAPSGIRDTPMSVEESMRGAEHRARHVFRQDPHEELYAVGVEGGLFTEHRRLFLQSWACVFNGERTSFGASGCVELPSRLAEEVIERNVELGIAIDRFARATDVRSNQGTFGIVTNDMVTREDSFTEAVLLAFMPFFNKNIYGTSGNK
jgi:inosine/xanthosine triphosphatase